VVDALPRAWTVPRVARSGVGDEGVTRRERVYRTEGIVLRRSDFGEADRLLTVLTPERGKLRLVAKGARKPSSRKSGHVELFAHSQLLVAVGRDLDIITQAETIEPFVGLRRDLLRTSYAYYLAELVDAFLAEHDENRPMFELLRESLGRLSTEGKDEGRSGESDLEAALGLVARYFELHLLSLAGYQPQLFSCVGCGKPLEPEVNYLSAADGGILCRDHGYDRVGTMELSVNALKVLRFLQTRDWETSRLLRLSTASREEVERALIDYITFHLERQVKSVEFMHRLQARS
jgi:DNA repair protein RecO (recombination protein O)